VSYGSGRKMMNLHTATGIGLFSLMLIGLAGCEGKAPQRQQQGAMPVQVMVAEKRPVQVTTEYIGTIRSQGSAVLKPQVDGHITRIFVHSGQRVSAGERLMQIDPEKQQAAVNTQEATREARMAQLELARIDLDRKKKLAAEGVISKQDLDQAQTAYNAALADVQALRASVAEQREQLRYYTIQAPTAGTVGDIPVRVGDRVATDTTLTTIDSGQEMELYISIPAEKAQQVRIGTPVEILGGHPLKTAVSFVSPRVDETTQLLLIKAPVSSNSGWRNEEVVHARVVWDTKDAVVLPFSAVSRLSGDIFAFVAEPKDNGFVAQQRRLSTGDMLGNDYVVLEGIKPGEKVIISGVQMLADGMPVTPMSPQPEQKAPEAAGAR